MTVYLSFNGQNIRESGDFQDVHQIAVCVRDGHFALLVHPLLRNQQNAQPRRGDIGSFPEVKGQLCQVFQRLPDGLLKLRRSLGVDPACDVQSQFASAFFSV
jgi:hypothetical protein